MKILQVIPYFAPAWSFGGPVKVCYQISKEMVNRGHNLTVWTTDASDLEKPITKLSESMDGMVIRRFKNLFPRLTHGYNIFTPIGFYNYAKKEINKYDLVHCHSFFTYQNIVISRLCRTKKIPYFIHLHEMPVPNPLLGKVLVKILFNFFFGKRILKDAAKIIVVSPREQEMLAKYLPAVSDRIEVIPNPIDNCEINIDSKKNIEKEDKKTILYLGRLSYLKAIDKLIIAFNELLKKDNSYKLIIAGPDESGNLANLIKLARDLNISERIEFTGLIAGTEKEKVFEKADIFALFSYYESFSIAAVEAMQHNLPCCLSRDVGIADEVKRTGCGIIVEDINNPKECAASLELTYKMRYKLSSNCSKILPLFDLSKVTDSIINIYKETL